jgi:integrase
VAKEMQTWTADELGAFLAGIRQDRIYAAWLVLATTGMRRGELLGLKWGDVDLERRQLSILRTWIVVDGHAQVSEPKTERGRRSVPVPAETLTALHAHRKAQLEDRLALGPGYQDGGLVFCREDGAPLHPDSFSQAFERHAVAAGLPHIRLHDVQHTWATLALRAGVPPKVVSEILGHANIGITLDTYSHAIPAMQEEAGATVAALIFPGRRQD